VCPARLLPQQLHWLVNSRQLERALDQQLSDCIECGCCDAVCPSHIPLVHQFQSAKREARARTTARAKAEQARRRFEARQTRLDEAQRERERAAAQRKAGLRQNAPAKLLEALARAQQKRNPGNAVPGRSDTVVEAGPAAGESSHAAG
jgi:electron transport complex protein RnfC